MSEELSALQNIGTWELVPLPPGRSLVSYRWIYKVKIRSNGNIERYKACLVARGFSQEYGIDYEETFAPVTKMTSVHTLLAIASIRNWPLFQLDVKNAFLHVDLQEDIFMQSPPGLPHTSGQVCRLRRALYGLKQAPRAWFEKFGNAIRSAGFTQSETDHAMFVHISSAGCTILLLYVDDMIITRDDRAHIEHTKRHLKHHFSMKDLEPLRYFLGLEITRNSRGILLSQQKYTADILSRATLSDSRTAVTPIESN
ncbi:AAA domain-containing protein [Psidium guajava]|nr:AAA domain-containing protein [Psidium guajava]